MSFFGLQKYIPFLFKKLFNSLSVIEELFIKLLKYSPDGSIFPLSFLGLSIESDDISSVISIFLLIFLKPMSYPSMVVVFIKFLSLNRSLVCETSIIFLCNSCSKDGNSKTTLFVKLFGVVT